MEREKKKPPAFPVLDEDVARKRYATSSFRA